MLISVDNLLITSNNFILIKSVQKKLHSKYWMRDLGQVNRYLGVEFVFSPKGTIIHQKSYAQ
jgi:hypothetical protein